MQCPFLKDTFVRSCRHALVRKLIVRNPENLSFERCSSPDYTGCELFVQSGADAAGDERCPYLDESLMQYCAAAPVPKFVPFSEAILSRCGSAAFRYCDLYLTMAHPDAAAMPSADGIGVPGWLLYAPNHMWLDSGEDGVCHIGIDAFFARALGEVDRITYLTPRGLAHPAVVIGAGPNDFHLVFPNRMVIATANVYLRANPAKLVTDPYRLGWLFECHAAPDGPEPRTGLYSENEALAWMRSEFDRMNRFVHGRQHELMADGGSFARGLIHSLDRAQTAQLYHDFFSPASMR